jgi:hypothetical protein
MTESKQGEFCGRLRYLWDFSGGDKKMVGKMSEAWGRAKSEDWNLEVPEMNLVWTR